MKAKTTARLNLRAGAEIADNRILVLPAGTEVEIIGTVDGWSQVRLSGYAATSYLEIQTPPPPPDRSLIGWHVSKHGLPESAYALLRRLSEAGRPLACVTVLYAEGANVSTPQLIKNASPETFVVLRNYVNPEPNVNPAAGNLDFGRTWFDKHISTLSKISGVDALQLANEWGTLELSGAPPSDPAALAQKRDLARRFAEFYIDLMQRATELGYTVTVGDLGVGQVEPYFEDVLEPMWAHAERMGHLANYHAYHGGARAKLTERGFTDIPLPHELDGRIVTSMPSGGAAIYYAMRWLRWLHKYPKLRVVFGEAGAGDAEYTRDPLLEVKRMAELCSLLRGSTPIDFGDAGIHTSDPARIIGFCWWTLGTSYNHWNSSNFEEALPALEAYLRS